MRVTCLLGCAFLTGLLAHPVPGQGLKKLADKEKNRREANATGGKRSTSYTNVGVRVRRTVHRYEDAIDITCYCTRTPAPRKKDTYWSKLKSEDQRRKVLWENKRRGYEYAYEQQRRTLEKLLVLQKSCNAGGVSVYWTEPWGTRWASPTWGLGETICSAVPEKIQKAKEALRHIEAEAHNEARKLRIDPGLARLN